MSGVLVVEDLRTSLWGPDGPVRAVRGVSLSIEEGTTLGLVGESGSGKTVFGRSIMRLYDPDRVAESSGRIEIDGVDVSALGEERMRDVRGNLVAMVFQDPMSSLNPVMKIGVQLTEQLRRHRALTRRDARAEAIELLAAVGIPRPEVRMNAYPHQLSGGMRQRVVIAMAISCNPRVLIADEPTTALDVTVQRQILDLLDRLQEEHRMTMLLVTHDLGVVATRADRIAVMYAGQVVEWAPTADLFERPLMPYTRALLDAIPRLEHPSHTRLQVIPGRPPNMVDPPAGCAFAPRCRFARERCRTEAPPLVRVSGTDHRYRCWFPLADVTPETIEEGD